MTFKAGRKNFYKLYFAAPKILPPSTIYLYYRGRPLYSPAMFERDRYVFALPKNLEEKMLAGELFADFTYADTPSAFRVEGKRVRVPGAILLSDRYE
ncbi:MAG TPA: hypothetical protein VEV84_15105 [Pyrinomonadaceae bacterium]|nr:hypothetical protein [Pyrinomonadaceae bacterium]